MALAGVKVVEIAGLAPAPFAGLCLADFGADVVRVDRVSKGKIAKSQDTLCRGKRSLALDLKSEEGLEVFKALIKGCDVLIEPFRPGVMEKLGLGPDELLAVNPRLIYARMTGFGQGGDPNVEKAAGHDTNYIAQSGVLSALRRQGERPLPPVNLLGDFGGGGLICAYGILLALIERFKSGKGQVVDAAMVDGAAYLASVMVLMSQMGIQKNGLDEVGTNLLDTGAHFYEVYTCKDGKHLSVGAIEPQFYKLLLEGMGLDSKRDNLPHQMDSSKWPEMKVKFAEIFKTRTQDEWAKIYYGKDACAFPILDFESAFTNKHNASRATYVKSRQFPGMFEAAAAPKLSRTKAEVPRKFPTPGGDTKSVLKEYGFNDDQISKIISSQNVLQAKL